METTFQPVLLLTDSCTSEYAPGKGKGKDVLEAPHAGGQIPVTLVGKKK
jgi:hypothetical protein